LRHPLLLRIQANRTASSAGTIVHSAIVSPMTVLRWGLVLSVCVVSACAAIPGDHYPREASHAVGRPTEGFAHTLANERARSNESAFRMISVGLDGLAARLELIDRAEAALDLQYYIFRVDESGGLVARALLRAADRGVRVRILLDDGESVAGDERLFALAAHPMIQVRVFNPFDYRGHRHVFRAIDFLLHKRRLDHRMHNKLMVADNALALIGGRNIGNQYFQIDPDSQFGDDDVVAYGPIVRQLSDVFDLFWNSAQAIPIKALEPRHSSAQALEKFRTHPVGTEKLGPFQAELDKRLKSGEPLAGVLSVHDPLTWANAELVYDSPDKASTNKGGNSAVQIYPGIAARAERARRELLMTTPYFVPSDAELSMLHGDRQRNVRIAILTNSLEAAPDVLAHAGYTHYRKSLLVDGMELHEIRASPEGTRTGQSKRISDFGNYGLHAKLYIFDRQSLFVGSMNFDQRSKHLNTEIGLIVDSPQMAESAAARFESLVALKNAYLVTLSDSDKMSLRWQTERDGRVVEFSREPARSPWQRFEARSAALLPLDKEL
jgi:cardiolipin synthase C